jgi:hypothetical protein
MTQPYYGPTGEDRQTIEYERTFVGVATTFVVLVG